MSAIVFTKGGTVVTWTTGRDYPVDEPIQHNVVVDYSEGGQAYCYDKGITEQFFFLACRNLDATTAAALQSFHQTTVVGPKETFTFTDEASNNHTVRWMDNRYPLKQTASGAYSGTITLRKEI